MPSSPRVLIYSPDVSVRKSLVNAIGEDVECVEVATGPAVLQQIAEQPFNAAILDGEANPFGGLGLAKQIRDEIAAPPPIAVVTGRRDDRWLARWSGADIVLSRPLDPFEIATTISQLLATTRDS